jgi:hypothetical protein
MVVRRVTDVDVDDRGVGMHSAQRGNGAPGTTFGVDDRDQRVTVTNHPVAAGVQNVHAERAAQSVDPERDRAGGGEPTEPVAVPPGVMAG